MSMLKERAVYIASCGTAGGSASGFRAWIKHRADEEPRLFPFDFLRDQAATRAWEAQPRKKGADLFSVAGVKLPEFMTRPKKGYDGDDPEDVEGFEKVDTRVATVADRYEDALIKLRGAARASASAEHDMQHADECRRRARGDMSTRLLDLADR